MGALRPGSDGAALRDYPLIWSDEVASILFLWLAMLGSAVAFQRGEHMRMTAVVGKLAPEARAFLDVLATAAALAFLLLVLPHAYEYAVEEAMMRTPAHHDHQGDDQADGGHHLARPPHRDEPQYGQQRHRPEACGHRGRAP